MEKLVYSICIIWKLQMNSNYAYDWENVSFGIPLFSDGKRIYSYSSHFKLK